MCFKKKKKNKTYIEKEKKKKKSKGVFVLSQKLMFSLIFISNQRGNILDVGPTTWPLIRLGVRVGNNPSPDRKPVIRI
jgi:hypothetical protein